MKNSRQHTNDQDRAFIDSLPKLDTNYSRSKEEVWATLSSLIDTTQEEKKPQAKVISLRPMLRRIATIAAVFAIIVGVSAAVIYKVVSDTKEELLNTQELANPTIQIKNGLFIFTNASLSYALDEIAREYNVKIEYSDTAERKYSGRFKRSIDIDKALHIVCRSMQLEYKKIDNKYIITKQ